MATLAKPRPLYSSRADCALWFKSRRELRDFPELTSELGKRSHAERDLWDLGLEFLDYIGRNKSPHTFNRFRGEIERFILWSWLVRKQDLREFKKQDILSYADFCWYPPATWIALANYDRFVVKQGAKTTNNHWRPFRASVSEDDEISQLNEKEKADLAAKRYRPSQQTLVATFTALVAFYKYLMNEEIVGGNPAQLAKKDCRHFIKDAQVSDVKRLSEEQWEFVLSCATTMADNNADLERNLFVIAALKTLFLRISELSEREEWTPEMRHFWEDTHGNWWLKVYGKGRKIRDVTVPTVFLEFLKRYRRTRALTPLPSSNDTSPIIEKLRGRGGMSARHLRRLVQAVFDEAFVTMSAEKGLDDAHRLSQATTHWLRHTGASMEIERGRALKDLSEDLGHASMATTDRIYIQSETKKRAASGKDREVK